MGPIERIVREQILAEYPQFETKTVVNEQNGREYNIERLTYYTTNKMWDAFDEALLDIEVKEES